MSLTTALLFLVGVGALVVGAEWLVRGASRLAVRTGVSPVVIGLTVVAFGTSTPELAVSVQAALGDDAGLALGNVVGSNIANVLLVLGLGAVVGGGLAVAQRIVRIDVPLMIAASVLVVLFSMDGKLQTLEGVVLIVLLVGYLVWTVRASRREEAAITAEYEEAIGYVEGRPTPVWLDLVAIVAGLVGLVAGATWLVSSATEIATWLGLSSAVIGLTVVAIGTSMPEVATTVLAALRGERDLAVGNAIGSNLMNLLAVLGITVVVSPSALDVSDQLLGFDMLVMVAVAIACLPVLFTGWLVARWEGFVFLGYYVAYVAYLVLEVTDHAATEQFATAMVYFVVPLTVLTLVVVAVRARRGNGLQAG